MLMYFQDGDTDTPIATTTSGTYNSETAETSFAVTLPDISYDDIGNYVCVMKFANSEVTSESASYLKLLCKFADVLATILLLVQLVKLNSICCIIDLK